MQPGVWIALSVGFLSRLYNCMYSQFNSMHQVAWTMPLAMPRAPLFSGWAVDAGVKLCISKPFGVKRLLEAAGAERGI